MAKFLLMMILVVTSQLQAATPIKIVVLGDSLSEGLGVSKEEAWPSLAETQLKKQNKVELLNRSVSGSTSASGLGRLKWLIKGSGKPDLLILELGANDGLRGLDLKETRRHLAQTIDFAKEAGIPVLLVGMQIPPNYGKAYAEEFRGIFPKLAKEKGVSLVPFLLEGVADKPTLNQADGIHPNAQGHVVMAKLMVGQIEKILRQLQKGKHAGH